MARRHDHDAGGDDDVLAAKAALRESIWQAMSVPGIRRFPAPDGRIPNFVQWAELTDDKIASIPLLQRLGRGST